MLGCHLFEIALLHKVNISVSYAANLSFSRPCLWDVILNSPCSIIKPVILLPVTKKSYANTEHAYSYWRAANEVTLIRQASLGGCGMLQVLQNLLLGDWLS